MFTTMSPVCLLLQVFTSQSAMGETGRLDLANLEAGRLGLTACRGDAFVGANVGIIIDAEARAPRVAPGLVVLHLLLVVVVEGRSGEDAAAVAEGGRIGLYGRVGDELVEVLVARLLKLFYTGV